MYIRPQLSRKSTRDRELLKKEHQEDICSHKEKISEGQSYEVFSQRLSEISEKFRTADVVSLTDKEPILREIASALEKLEKEYYMNIQSDLSSIEFSIDERISEMEMAAKQWDEEVVEKEQIKFKSNSVDEEKLRHSAYDLQKEYCLLVEQSKAELQKQVSSATNQREKIRKNISKRGG